MTIQLNQNLKTEIKELLPVITQCQQGIEKRLVDARTLWKFLGSKQEFANWIKNNIQAYGFKKDKDYCSFDKIIKRGTGATKAKEYLLTISMAKELAMVERNEQGKSAREYFIKCEETLLALAPERVEQLRQLWRVGREAVKTPFIKLCNALERNRTRNGKQTKQHHYYNEINMLTSLVLGTNVQQWKKAHNIKGDIRNALNIEQLAKLDYLETADRMLLDMNIYDFHQRKNQLAEMLKIQGKVINGADT